MIDPIFQLNLNSNFTLQPDVQDGAAATTPFEMAAVPAGINRVYFAAHVGHTDNAGAHELQLAILNPQGTPSVMIPLQKLGTTANTESNAILRPFFVPSGYHLKISSADAIPAGKNLLWRAFYMDYMVGP